MSKYNISIPTRIVFGQNVIDDALKSNSTLIKGKILIVTGRNSMRKLGYIDRIENILHQMNSVTDVVVYENITPNPRTIDVNEAITIGLNKNIDVVIGLGGGSAIDAAKAIAVGIGAREYIDEYLISGKSPSKETLPVIAIPTTAGSGSELSMGAIITDQSRKIKTGIRGEKIFPSLAIVDPSFTYQLPLKITCETGFDVFTHAVETLISNRANPFTEMLSKEAIKIVKDNLPILVKDISNIDARKNMSYASMLMGINLGNSSTCLPHRLQYPIGAITDTSHSAGLASIYRSWIYHTYNYSSSKFNLIGTLLSDKKCESLTQVLESLNRFMSAVNMDTKLINLGIKEHDLDLLEESVTGNLSNDPGFMDKSIVKKIYRSAFYNEY